MRVLMFGWEFPPFNSGGLGTACYGLTKGLAKSNVDITFVIPQITDNVKAEFVKLVSAGNLPNIKIREINSPLRSYITSEQYHNLILSKTIPHHQKEIYGQNLFEEVYRFTEKAALIAAEEEHDIIHAHDWMTYQAGIRAREVSKKPLVVHVHATEFDRTGNGCVNQLVYDLEKSGMLSADSVIAVSNYTKMKIVERYGIPPNKVNVIYNAVDTNENNVSYGGSGIGSNKVVLFLGRITLQKGPDYFLYAAKKVLEIEPNVRFIMAGVGDMMPKIIEKASELGIGEKVLFTGFLGGQDVDRAYQMANVYVMPSVSEPFGITPLEAMKNKTPVIISKQSGVSEIISSCLKVDFWDINKMANQILGVLRYDEVNSSLKENGFFEVQKISWENSAKKCVEVYNKLLEAGS